jgi:flagellar motor protein MotB
MKFARNIFPLIFTFCLSTAPAFADEPALPDFILKAQLLIGQAETKAAQLKDYADDILIAKNFLRNAEGEFKKNLSWSGKLDEKAEPTVRYFAEMAQLQARIILSRVEKIAQEKERGRLDALAAQVMSKIKVFDDKNAEITTLKGEIGKREATIAALGKKIAALNADLESKSATGSSANQRLTDLSGELQTLKSSLAFADQKAVALAAELDSQKKKTDYSNVEIARLKNELAKTGAEASKGHEQVQALNRAKEFLTEVSKLDGVMKANSDTIIAIFTRASLINTGKNVTTTPAGDKLGLALAELLKNYPEYRAVIKVHGFGQPAKSEDAAATDQMARLLREVAVGKGKLDPASVEALGVGQANPVYPKNNPEGNRRVEITFVKKFATL